MADTNIQHKIESWVRDKWMPKTFGQKFYQEKVRLSSGGFFEFDAVSEDNKIVALISTSGARTARGKRASGKLHKIRSDMFFLLLVPNIDRRIVVLTEADMYKFWEKEKESGRVPSSIEFKHAEEIPEKLVSKLTISRGNASREVTSK